MKKKIYTILRTETNYEPYYEVIKPSGEAVNGAKFKSINDAEKKLELLVAMGYCRRED